LSRFKSAILAAALAVLSACSSSSGTVTTSVFDRPTTLVRPVSALASVADVLVLDRAKSALIPVFSDGTTGPTVFVESPPNGWPTGLISAWQTTDNTVEFALPASGGGYWFSVLGLDDLAQTAWVETADVQRILIWDGMVRLVTGSTIAVTTTVYQLPSISARIPEQVDASGFPVLLDGSIAWWDPVSGVARWHYGSNLTGGVLAFSHGKLAWTAPGAIAMALASSAGITDVRMAPVEAAINHLEFQTNDPNQLFFSSSDGFFQSVVSGSEPGVLCFIDRDSAGAGSTISGLAFIDVESVSNPDVKVNRIDREGCPGWTRNDEWRIEYEGGPVAWSDLAAGAITQIDDFPFAAFVTDGMQFRDGDQIYNLVTTEPIAWNPSVPPAAVTGSLFEPGRWAMVSSRAGLVGLVSEDGNYQSPALDFQMVAGSDGPDQGDRFLFNTNNGVSTFRATVAYDLWVEFEDQRLLALDRKSGEVQIFDLSTDSAIAVLR